ncbi:helix-turn-helix domain-containing protein [Neorhizobium sp. NPDC001467]|uniref:helix-turn-helix domain-containing protein n=1 Tax=Neorhizobium sp. NPDC001467 TaxID=3390595 RepID=UPI003D051A8B
MVHNTALGEASSRGYEVAPASLLARTVIPSVSQRSSRDFGWRSLLVDVHSGVSSNDRYTSVPTPDIRIGVTLSGTFLCDSQEKDRWRQDTFAPGSIMLHYTPEQTNYRFPEPRNENFQLALIYVPEDLVLSANEEFRRIGVASNLPEFRSAPGRDRAIFEVAYALVDAMEQEGGELYAQAVATWLATHVVSRYGSAGRGDDKRSAGELSDPRLARVIEFMSASYGQALTLEQLAAEACISKFHFLRLFKEKTGQSPIQHLADIRVRAAKRMLLTSDLSVSEIARLSGFASSSHLARHFASRFGLTPSRYRTLSAATGTLTDDGDEETPA